MMSCAETVGNPSHITTNGIGLVCLVELLGSFHKFSEGINDRLSTKQQILGSYSF